MAELTPMMQQYTTIKDKYKDCILLFRLGDFYEMFFDDAVLASRILDLVLTGRDCGLAERAPMCGVPHHAVDAYISRLLAAGHKVAVCDQLEDASAAQGMVKRGVTRVVTPGTATEPSMLTDTENNYIASALQDSGGWGLAYADVSTGEFVAYEVGPDVNLAGELLRIGPRELLYAQGSAGKLEPLFSDPRFNKVFLSPYADGAFAHEAALSVLESHFSPEDLDSICKRQLALRAAGALLRYLNETQMNNLAHINRIGVPQENNYMVLDPACIRNLELVQTMMEGGKKGSLLWLLDKTKTSMGARMMRRVLLNPLKNVRVINARLDAVEQMRGSLSLLESLREAVTGVHDLERLLSRICYGSLNARDCISLRGSLERLPAVKTLLASQDVSLLKELNAQTDILDDIRSILTAAIEDDPPPSLRDGGIIRRGFNPEVDRLRDASEKGREWLLLLEARERETTGIKNLRVGYNKVFGYFLEVTKSYQNIVPGRYIRKQTLANCERYITDELKEMEDTILNAEEKRCTVEYGVFLELRALLEQAVPRIQQTASAIAMLDVLQSLAALAYEMHYVRPQITAGGKIYIKDGRHPVIEKIVKGAFVPNNVLLDGNENNLLLITGPNMAGKSTYMRQTGLIVIMAHIGSFVPASLARICLVDRVFTRVGASDDLSSGQSTFMVEMNELAGILRNATKESLIILDEIGRGTSTVDGLSIAWSTVEYLLANVRAKTLFATHFHELVEIQKKHPQVKNYSVAVREFGREIVFLHKIVPGGTDKSFGVEVARLAGLPAELTENAKKMLGRIVRKEVSLLEDEKPQELQQDTAKHDKLIHRLKKMDVNTLTPLEALNLLSRISEELADE